MSTASSFPQRAHECLQTTSNPIHVTRTCCKCRHSTSFHPSYDGGDRGCPCTPPIPLSGPLYCKRPLDTCLHKFCASCTETVKDLFWKCWACDCLNRYWLRNCMRCGYLQESGGCGEFIWRLRWPGYKMGRKHKEGEKDGLEVGMTREGSEYWISEPPRKTGRERRGMAVRKWFFCGL